MIAEIIEKYNDKKQRVVNQPKIMDDDLPQAIVQKLIEEELETAKVELFIYFSKDNHMMNTFSI